MLRRLLKARQVTHADLELCYIPAVDRVAGLLRSGAIGALQTASIRLHASWGPKPGYDICNINHMSSWYVDLMNRILGGSPARVFVLDGTVSAGDFRVTISLISITTACGEQYGPISPVWEISTSKSK